jgi:hypothetical protein
MLFRNRCDCDDCRNKEINRRRDPSNKRHGSDYLRRIQRPTAYVDRVMYAVGERVQRRIAAAKAAQGDHYLPWGALVSRNGW